MKWVEHHEVSGDFSVETKNIGDVFPFVLALVDGQSCLVLIAGVGYPVELVKVPAS